MLACIPTNGEAGLDDTVSEHFGSAPYFTLYNAAIDEIQVIDNRNAQHSHGTCHPLNQLRRYHIDAIICRGMGRRAILALNGEGIRTYEAGSARVADVVEQIRSNSLVEMDPARACRGHGQRQANTATGVGFRQGDRGLGRGGSRAGGCNGR
jgi:predicted Fe-Mo cluster-binding NifX family protein